MAWRHTRRLNENEAAQRGLRFDHESSKTPRDTLMLGYFEQVLNGLAYELYFPDELHAHGLSPFDLVTRANLPALDTLTTPKRLPRLRELFETHYQPEHPLCVSVGKLQTLDTIRIIEGRE